MTLSGMRLADKDKPKADLLITMDPASRFTRPGRNHARAQNLMMTAPQAAFVAWGWKLHRVNKEALL